MFPVLCSLLPARVETPPLNAPILATSMTGMVQSSPVHPSWHRQLYPLPEQSFLQVVLAPLCFKYRRGPATLSANFGSRMPVPTSVSPKYREETCFTPESTLSKCNRRALFLLQLPIKHLGKPLMAKVFCKSCIGSKVFL